MLQGDLFILLEKPCRRSASKDMFDFLKVYYLIHKISIVHHILIQINLGHTLRTYV